MQIYGVVKCHLTLNVRKASKIRSPHPHPLLHLFRMNLASKLSGGALNGGMSHLLFPLISLENLVKIGGDSNELVFSAGCRDSSLFSQLSCLQDAVEGGSRGGNQPKCKDEK